MGRLKQIEIDVDINRLIEEGRRSFDESENDILRRILLADRAAQQREAAAPPPPPPFPPAVAEQDEPRRVRGNWAVEYQGEMLPAANLKDAYRTLLLRLADDFPNFLDEFASFGSRSRRFVARTPHELYANSPHLTTTHARILGHGWFYDTNLSADQISQRARVAARICGLNYGSDIKVMSNLVEI